MKPLENIVIIALTFALFATPTFADLSIAGLKPFTQNTNYMSLRGHEKYLQNLKPDLIISKVEFRPDSVKAGILIQPIVYYKNVGGAVATNFYLSLAPNDLNEGGLGLGGDFASLSPGQEKSYLWAGMRAKEPGTYTFTFSIDPKHEVDELDEQNNELTVTLHVLP